MMLNNHEWPRNTLDNMTDSIIKTAKLLRQKSSSPMVPSPDPEAHVRFKNGTSRHDVGVDGSMRESDATDLFLINNIDAARVWNCALAIPEIGGLGIYFDSQVGGQKRVLFHIDNRPDRLMWVCPSRKRSKESRSYIYFREDNPSAFLEILAHEFDKLRR